MRRTLFVAALLALTGCANANPGLSIRNVVAPDDSCTYAEGNPQMASGVLDVGIAGNTYEATFVFVNQLLTLANTGLSGYPVMTDPNNMMVQQVEVEIQDIGGNALGFTGPNPFTVPAGGSLIPAGDGMEGGLALGQAQIVPAAYVAELGAVAGTDAQIVVSVRAIGQTAGGAEVVSQDFAFPIQLCSGCLAPMCLMDDEMMPVCLPSCTVGQDTVHYACDPTCIAGMM